MSNYDVFREELIEESTSLIEGETLGKNFFKFEKKFDKLIEILSFQMLSDDKFYGNFLINAKRVKCYSIPTCLAHQVRNNGVYMLINPLIFIKHTNEEVVNLMKHEVIHLIAEHFTRVNKLEESYPRIIPLLASDLVANQILSKEVKELGKQFWTAKRVKEIFDFDITVDDNSTIESLSEKISEEAQTNELLEMFIKRNSGAKMESFLGTLNTLLEDVSDSIGQDDMEDEEDMERSLAFSILQCDISDDMLISDMLKHVIIESATSSRGMLPSGLAGLIKKLMEPPVITWEEELRRFVASIKAGKKPTLFRRNRRQPDRVDLKGELNDKSLEVVVAIDTSGSMDDDSVARCMVEIFALTKLMKASITIVECDTAIQKVYKANIEADVQPEIIGRGGTSFSPVFNWVNDNASKDAIVIYMSDGFGENQLDCKPLNQGTLWIMTGHKGDLSLKGGNLPRNHKVLSLSNS